MLLQLWMYHHLSRSFLFVNPLRTIFLVFFKFSEGPLTNTSNMQLHWQPSHWSYRVAGISLHIWVPHCSCSDPSWGTWTWKRTFMVALSLLFFNTWWLSVDFSIKLISHSITCSSIMWESFFIYTFTCILATNPTMILECHFYSKGTYLSSFKIFFLFYLHESKFYSILN